VSGMSGIMGRGRDETNEEWNAICDGGGRLKNKRERMRVQWGKKTKHEAIAEFN